MKNLEVAMKVASSTLFQFYLKVHFVHLNITGPNFYEFHKMLDKIYKDTFDSFDAISEQIRTLDIFAPASLSAFKKFGAIEDLNEAGEAKAMLYELLLDSEKLVEVIKGAYHMATDHPGLQNFLQGLIEKQEFWQWMLRSSIQGK